MADEVGMIVEGRLHAATLAELHAGAFEAPMRWDAVAMAELLAMPGCFACLSLPDGMALLRVALDEAELLSVAVQPAARGRGVGRALLARSLGECARRGARWIFLEVRPDNHAALALYRGIGFKPIGQRPRYYEDGSDALVLSRALPPRRV